MPIQSDFSYIRAESWLMDKMVSLEEKNSLGVD
ncbi:hypothetical protein JOC77_003092 [Peribacillus deserti]|uniref:Uncharacterized protein n=1 Tax=Peribacillus deserti TaxID=673318 RepID=A0ABS2QKE0_9BACI|nr:hypothetical protein [Peribacillus deserti]